MASMNGELSVVDVAGVLIESADAGVCWHKLKQRLVRDAFPE